METKQTEAKPFVLNYGLLLGILSVIVGAVMYVTDAYLNPSFIYSIISFLILITVITLGIKAYKQENGGFLSLGEALKVGIGVAVIGGIISAIWSYILMNFIEPDFMIQTMEASRDKMMENNPDMTPDQMEKALEMGASFNSPWIIMAVSLIGNLFFGLVISLIAGLVMKRESPYKG